MTGRNDLTYHSSELIRRIIFYEEKVVLALVVNIAKNDYKMHHTPIYGDKVFIEGTLKKDDY